MRAERNKNALMREWAGRMRCLWSTEQPADDEDMLLCAGEAAWLLFVDDAELARVQSALTPTDFDGEQLFRLSDLRQFTAKVLKIYPFGAVPANDGGNWWY